MHKVTDSKRVQNSLLLLLVASQMPPTTEDGEIPKAAILAADPLREKVSYTKFILTQTPKLWNITPSNSRLPPFS